MAWQPDPLLMELFESLQQQLADALEVCQRRRHTCAEDSMALSGDTPLVARLRSQIAALEGALERRDSRIVH